MINKNRILLMFLLLTLMISACSDTDGSSPNLVEISSEDENKVIDEEDNEDSTDEEFENNEDSTEEEFEYTPPVLPDLPDLINSSNTLSKDAESEFPAGITGFKFSISSNRGLNISSSCTFIQFTLPFKVFISPLCAKDLNG